MIHTFHPEAATEYAEHVAFYKSLRKELGIRFHEAVKLVIANVCAMPDRYSTEFPPDIRRARVNDFGFPFKAGHHIGWSAGCLHPCRQSLHSMCPTLSAKP